MILKLKIVVDTDGEPHYTDFYTDASTITGFYVSEAEEIEGETHCHICLIASNTSFCVKPEKKITDYLMENLVEVAQ